jgi:hypothetical protein
MSTRRPPIRVRSATAWSPLEIAAPAPGLTNLVCATNASTAPRGQMRTASPRGPKYSVFAVSSTRLVNVSRTCFWLTWPATCSPPPTICAATLGMKLRIPPTLSAANARGLPICANRQCSSPRARLC